MSLHVTLKLEHERRSHQFNTKWLTLAKEYLLSKKKGSFLPASDKLKDYKPLAKRQQQKVQHQRLKMNRHFECR